MEHPEHLVRKELGLRDRALLEHRLETEHDAGVRREAFVGEYHEGPPPLPDAQIVYCREKDHFGLAIRGGRFVCPLPKGYVKAGIELTALPEGRWRIDQVGMSPLLANPMTGEVRRM